MKFLGVADGAVGDAHPLQGLNVDLAIYYLVLVCGIAGAVAPFQNEQFLVCFFIRKIALWVAGFTNDMIWAVAAVLLCGVVVGGAVRGFSGVMIGVGTGSECVAAVIRFALVVSWRLTPAGRVSFRAVVGPG